MPKFILKNCFKIKKIIFLVLTVGFFLSFPFDNFSSPKNGFKERDALAQSPAYVYDPATFYFPTYLGKPDFVSILPPGSGPLPPPGPGPAPIQPGPGVYILDFPTLYQCDSRWGYSDYCGYTMCQTGCAITSAAAIIKYFNPLSYPDDNLLIHEVEQYCTNITLANGAFLNKGLSPNGVWNFDGIAYAIKHGHYPIFFGIYPLEGSCHPYKPYHYMVIKGVNENTRELYLMDPINLCSSISESEFLSYLKEAYVITPSSP